MTIDDNRPYPIIYTLPYRQNKPISNYTAMAFSTLFLIRLSDKGFFNQYIWTALRIH